MKNTYHSPEIYVFNTYSEKCLCTSSNSFSLPDYNEETIIEEDF